METNSSIPDGLPASVTPQKAHHKNISGCYEPIADSKWGATTFCDSTVTLRAILFTNAMP